MVGGQHHRAVVQADVVEGGAGNWAIRWRDRQGAGGEILPRGPPLQCAVSTMRRCMVPSHSIRVAMTLSSSFCSRADTGLKARQNLIGQSMVGVTSNQLPRTRGRAMPPVPGPGVRAPVISARISWKHDR